MGRSEGGVHVVLGIWEAEESVVVQGIRADFSASHGMHVQPRAKTLPVDACQASEFDEAVTRCPDFIGREWAPGVVDDDASGLNDLCDADGVDRCGGLACVLGEPIT